MSSDQPAIAVRGLAKEYRIHHLDQKHTTLAERLMYRLRHPLRREQVESFWALREVTFDVSAGEVVGIIGRNGAGKTTLLKLLSRITEPTRGEADLYGRVGSLLEVGTGFHRELSGRENIFLNGSILGLTRREIRESFDAIVEFSGVQHFLDTPVKRYSSGMYVRLAFAVAAHLQPEILVVDEVLSVGDAAFQRKCLGKMGDVARSGRTVLFVSHNMAAVRSLCTRVIWLEDGRLKRDGSADEVVDEYLEHVCEQRNDALDFKTLARPAPFGEKMRLTDIRFNDDAPIRHGEPLKVSIDYETYDDLAEVVIGFGFASMDGVRLASCDSDVPGDRQMLAAGTRGSVDVHLPRLDLQPGHYLLQAGARSGQRAMLDLIDQDVYLDVLPGPRTPAVIIGQRAGVRMPGEWRWSHGNGELDTRFDETHENESPGAPRDGSRKVSRNVGDVPSAIGAER